MNKKIYLETHGCTFNKADTNIMTKILDEKGYIIVDNLKDADVIILNTCYVKLPTEQKMITQIQKIKENYPDKKLIIGGCMVEVDDVRLNKFAHDNCWIGPHKVDKVDKVVQKALNDEVVHEYGKTDLIKAGANTKTTDSLIHILQICEGCNGVCTFCCTRRARGHLVSYPIQNIVDEAQQAINNGAKELQVTAQDTACYGFDTGESFPELLRKLANLDGEYRIRVGMMHPKSLRENLDEIIEVFKQNPKIYNFIHLPIQTGSEKVLSEMNRLHTIDEYKCMLNKFKTEIPDLTFATDIIVGYPTETEEDFQETLELLDEIKPDIIHISKYMHRPTATSNTLKEIDHITMKDRSHRVNQMKDKVMFENNEKYVSKTYNVLVLAKGSSGGYVGYTDAYKNVIIPEDVELGTFHDVKIVKPNRTYLLSELIE